MRRFLLISAVFAVVLLYGLTVATGSSNVLSDYFWWIVALCGLLLLVLAAVLVRYVVLLMRDNSKSVFGSQIARRLSGMFTLVAVLPGVFLFGISAQFINGTINSWFGNDTHEALERSLNLSKSALNLAVDNAVSNATPVQIDLISAASLDGNLGQTLAKSALTADFAQLARNLRTEHAFAVVAHQKHDIAYQHRRQHQQQQATQSNNPPEVIGQYAAATRCNSQTV